MDPRALKPRIAVIENHPQNRQAAQAVEFRQVGGKPGWALDGQDKCQSVSRVSEVPQFDFLREKLRTQSSTVPKGN